MSCRTTGDVSGCSHPAHRLPWHLVAHNHLVGHPHNAVVGVVLGQPLTNLSISGRTSSGEPTPCAVDENMPIAFIAAVVIADFPVHPLSSVLTRVPRQALWEVV
jgi:hypothetical protein